ncbi:3-phosphoshikimate 1-carboxyvinyltransferase [Longispora sp. K20-0274]|uniref:3-phosphoshikimate 1-carboxyvinyltransferase n=1 Tax=Longispora sp. K20-0274 TaxID=3088255 RepID=UPI00399B3320
MSPSTIARIPGSPALTSRALVIATAAPGSTRLIDPLVSEDTLACARAVRAMGFPVHAAPGLWTVEGTGPGDGRRLWCEDSGAVARFLPAPAATGGIRGGDGVPAGHPGGRHLTGLLLAAPLRPEGLRVRVPRPADRPDVDLTVALMRHFGVDVTEPEPQVLVVRPGGYRATELRIEPDATAAAYVFAAAALTATTVTVEGLGAGSSQGDLMFVEVLARMGAEVTIGAAGTTVAGPGRLRGGFTVDMGDLSDVFMTLACLVPFADAPVRIGGLAHVPDRVAATAANLRACGIAVDCDPDGLTVSPGTPRATLVSCRGDHRTAMAFSVLGLRVPIYLDDLTCVRRTFPGFHAELARLFGQA